MNTVNPEIASYVLQIVTGLLVIALLILHLVRYCKKPKWLNMFYVWIGTLIILGGTWGFFLPIAINSGFNKDDDGPVLRQLLLYATGGILGAFTLGETHRRNNLEKDKNGQDHIRQAHAERRNRYTTAVEQLSSDKASIRLGGVYTLIGLVDEWLADKSLKEYERQKEGQIIINNLCTYIRSPFDLGERHDELILSYEKYKQNFQRKNNNSQQLQSREKFINDKTLFYEEKEIRSTILTEIKSRLRSTITNKDGTKKFIIGKWSRFDYNFKNAIFFYKFDLQGAIFTGNTISFEEAVFKDEAIFNEVASYPKPACTTPNKTTFLDMLRSITFNHTRPENNTISFKGAKFNGKTSFDKAILNFSNISFENVDFNGNTHFKNSIFAASEPSFKNTEFAKDAIFEDAIFGPKTTFEYATFTSGNTSFKGTEFTQTIYFPDDYEIHRKNFFISDSCASFKKTAFKGVTSFKEAIFNIENTSFKEAKFTKISEDGNYTISFDDTLFVHKVSFKDAKFACGSKNNFDINSKGRTNKIDFYDHTTWDGYNPIFTSIPKECIVFDPKTGEETPHTPTPPNGSV